MSQTQGSGTLFYNAESQRFSNLGDREIIPRRFIYAMFGVAGLALLLTTYAVLTGRPPTGVAPVEPVASTHVATLSGDGDAVKVVAPDGTVLMDAENGAFVAVIRHGLDTARRRHRVTGNPPVEFVEWESGRMTLRDPASGWTMEVSSFGRGNLMQVRALFAQ